MPEMGWGSMGKYGDVWGSSKIYENKTENHSSELEHASSRVGLHAPSALGIGEARSDAKRGTPEASMGSASVAIAPYISYYSIESYMYIMDLRIELALIK